MFMSRLIKSYQQMMKKLVLCIVLFIGSVSLANSQTLNDSTLMAELIKNDIKFPEIVLAQAKLETGNYTSRICRVKNNLFGLNSARGYRTYTHWTESVKAYKKLIQSKYKGGDYYKFLENLGYAGKGNTLYTKCLKRIVKK